LTEANKVDDCAFISLKKGIKELAKPLAVKEEDIAEPRRTGATVAIPDVVTHAGSETEEEEGLQGGTDIVPGHFKLTLPPHPADTELTPHVPSVKSRSRQAAAAATDIGDLERLSRGDGAPVVCTVPRPRRDA